MLADQHGVDADMVEVVKEEEPRGQGELSEPGFDGGYWD